MNTKEQREHQRTTGTTGKIQKSLSDVANWFRSASPYEVGKWRICSTTMAWETRRNGNRYYYRKRREGNRVKSLYVGRGAIGEVASGLDREARDERAERLCELNEDKKQAEQAATQTKTLVAEILGCLGYHWKRGEWRKQRC